MHRLARLLHQAQSSDEPVAKETVVLGMESEDQRIAETNTVHKAPRQEARVLMLHILSINGAVTRIRLRLSQCCSLRLFDW